MDTSDDEVDKIQPVVRHNRIQTPQYTPQVLFNIQSYYYKKAQERKPRSLIFNPANPDLFLTSSLDNSIIFWKLNDIEKKFKK